MAGYKILSAIRLMALLPFLLFGFASLALAGENYGVDIGEKLGRGLVNVATGWVEIPKNIVNTSQDSSVGIGVTWGLVKGIANTIGRTLVGAGELATFFIPTPELVHPPYVFEDFYRDTTYGTAH
jgi:putative exosortase-associated protein (TIGR04073 family)